MKYLIAYNNIHKLLAFCCFLVFANLNSMGVTMPGSIGRCLLKTKITFGSTMASSTDYFSPDGHYYRLQSSLFGPSGVDHQYPVSRGIYSASISGDEITITQTNEANEVDVSAYKVKYSGNVAWGGDLGSFNTEFVFIRLSEDQSFANLSTRVNLRDGEVATCGFVVPGTVSRLLLIRVIGKSLLGFGVPNAATSVTGTIYRGSAVYTKLVDNSVDAVMSSRASAMAELTGAFSLGDNANDAITVGNFSPGAYTVQAKTGIGGGEVLVEIYAVP